MFLPHSAPSWISAKLKIWQVSACKMEPQRGWIMWRTPATHPPTHHRLTCCALLWVWGASGMYGRRLEGFWKVSKGCLKGEWKASGRLLKGVWKVSVRCLWCDCNVSGRCLKGFPKYYLNRNHYWTKNCCSWLHLGFQLSWKSSKFQLSKWSLRETVLNREPHPTT